jgi:hypothetical protein
MNRAGRLDDSLMVFAFLCCLLTACITQPASQSKEKPLIERQQRRLCDQIITSWISDSSLCGNARNAITLQVIIYHCGYHEASLPVLKSALGSPNRTYQSRSDLTILEYHFDQRCDSPLKEEYDRCWGEVESAESDGKTNNRVRIICQ